MTVLPHITVLYKHHAAKVIPLPRPFSRPNSVRHVSLLRMKNCNILKSGTPCHPCRSFMRTQCSARPVAQLCSCATLASLWRSPAKCATFVLLGLKSGCGMTLRAKFWKHWRRRQGGVSSRKLGVIRNARGRTRQCVKRQLKRAVRFPAIMPVFWAAKTECLELVKDSGRICFGEVGLPHIAVPCTLFDA